MDMEQSENSLENIESKSDQKNEPVKKRGRPKVIQDMTQHRKEYHKKRYEEIKDVIIEKSKERYVNNKEEKIKATKLCAKKYRDAYKVLLELINENVAIPSHLKQKVLGIVPCK